MDAKDDVKTGSEKRLQALKKLLREGAASTQEELVEALLKKKFSVTQSTMSRDLRRVGAIKTTNAEGEVIYRLPEEPRHLPSPVSDTLGALLLDIEANESLIVIHTAPGSASLVARHIDNLRKSLGILGTIAGDDAIFVAPVSVKKIPELMKSIKEEF